MSADLSQRARLLGLRVEQGGADGCEAVDLFGELVFAGPWAMFAAFLDEIEASQALDGYHNPELPR